MPQPPVKKFEGDFRDATLDTILDYSLAAVFPFLTRSNHRELAEKVAAHLSHHLSEELGIVNGARKDEATSPVAVRLKKTFDEAR